MDERPFLAAILAAPDDDGPRLIYADWLVEQGECERAELIRLQCHREPPVPSSSYDGREGMDRLLSDAKRCSERRLRQWELMTPKNVAKWSGVGLFITEQNWRRGFVETIDGITAANWMRYADALLSRHPIRHVMLTTRPVVIAISDKPGPEVIVEFKLAGRARAHAAARRAEFVGETEEWILAEEWPGITFDFPEPDTPLLAAYAEAITRQTGRGRS